MGRWVEKDYEMVGHKGKLETVKDSKELINFTVFEINNTNTMKSLYDLNIQMGIIMGCILMLKEIEVIDEEGVKKLSEVSANAVAAQEAKIIEGLKKEKKE